MIVYCIHSNLGIIGYLNKIWSSVVYNMILVRLSNIEKAVTGQISFQSFQFSQLLLFQLLCSKQVDHLWNIEIRTSGNILSHFSLNLFHENGRLPRQFARQLLHYWVNGAKVMGNNLVKADQFCDQKWGLAADLSKSQ